MFKTISSSVVEMFWSYIFSNHELIYFANGDLQIFAEFLISCEWESDASLS